MKPAAAAIDFEVAGEGGVRITGSQRGDGPPVLLIHGFPDDRTLWDHQVDALIAAGHTTIAVDQRGFGASGKPDDWKAYRAYTAAADMTHVLDSLGYETADVVGHDWGAATASFLAMFHPERVDRLTLMSAGHPALFHSLGLDQLKRAWYMLFFQDEVVASTWLRANNWANMREWGEHPDEDAAIGRLSEPGALASALRWYRANSHPGTLLPPKSPLPKIIHSTMGIWSSDDPHLVENFVLETADQVEGDWRYERVDDAGHWMQLDQPDVVANLLVDFLAR